MVILPPAFNEIRKRVSRAGFAEKRNRMIFRGVWQS